MEYEKRIEKIREFIDREKIEVLFTKNPSHIFYLTGLLEIEGYLLIDKKNIYFFTTPLYIYEAKNNIEKREKFKNIEIKNLKNKNFQKFLSSYKKVGFFKSEISYSDYQNLKKYIKIYPFDDFILNLRMIKEKEEIDLIKKAIEITEKSISQIEIKEGISELEIVGQLKYLLIKNGARKESFPIIVASGINSSYPHHKPSKRKIKNKEPIIIDIGADLNGYKSDITYTFLFGNVDDEIKKIYKFVQDSQKLAIEFIYKNKKTTGKYVYKNVMEFFKRYNIDKYFLHGLGHGIGIDVHEKPYLNKNGNEILKKGNVFTVEPGIYIEKKFGIRLEKVIFL